MTETMHHPIVYVLASPLILLALIAYLASLAIRAIPLSLASLAATWFDDDVAQRLDDWMTWPL